MELEVPGPGGRSRRRLVLLIALGCAAALATAAGWLSGRYLRLDLPDVRALEDYTPPVMTRVLADDGSLLATFAEERRMLIEVPDIPKRFQQALIATEDSSFLSHPGVDVRGIVRALWSDLRHLEMKQGASTLTQQLARNLFLHPEKTIRRKLQEVVLALEIERHYSKQEILRFYCNQIYMGHGRYGLEAAARFYFGKPARELSLSESATLAGLIQRPESLSPLRDPARAISRRNHVLNRMTEEGYLATDEAAAARAEPIALASRDGGGDLAPYFTEEIRRWLQQRYGSSSLYREGLEVRTTLDPRLQAIANLAVDAGLRELDKRQGWRGATERVPDGIDPERHEPESWRAGIVPGRVVDGVVTDLAGNEATVRVGAHTGRLRAADVAWTGRKPGEILRRGDLVRVRVVELPAAGGALLQLEQEPRVEAALVAIDPANGAVRALVGGFDFGRSEYDRATQAKRQTGSAFKPFVYAAALTRGLTLADTIVDEPTVFLAQGAPEPYQPENYSDGYYATVTLREALESSANIATVKLLLEVGYEPVIDLARRLGISTPLRPFPSLALGAFEISLLELTSAYGVFAHQGVLVEPHLVEEVRSREGDLLAAVEPEIRDAVRPEIAYLMNRVLSGVITDGTGRAAAALGLPLAGKTGTTDNNTDAWFIGYSPEIVVGVWVGFDEPRSLGRRETGSVAALPIWRSFMQQAYAGREIAEFPQPQGVRIVAIDRRTGKRANAQAGCREVLSEVFVAGSEPTTYCTASDHARLALPYPFQRYALDENGALVVPTDELEALLEQERSVARSADGSRLEAMTPTGSVSIALSIVPPPAEPVEPDPRLAPVAARFGDTEWRGIDGRLARIVWIE